MQYPLRATPASRLVVSGRVAMMTTNHEWEQLTPLQLAALFALDTGTETTLLVLQLVNDAVLGPALEQPASEAKLVKALTELEAGGLVCRPVIEHPDRAMPGCGVPEYDQGRSEVSWWDLTPAGKNRVDMEAKRLQ